MKEMVNVLTEVKTTNYVDAQTGELLDEKKDEHRSVSKQQVKNKRADLYFNVYDECPLFAQILSLGRAETAVLFACASASQSYTQSMLERYNYPGNMVVANAKFRQWVCEASGLAESSVKEALSSLVKKGFMLKDPQAKGIYYLNPEALFKGYSGIRTKLLNAPVHYEEEILSGDDDQPKELPQNEG